MQLLVKLLVSAAAVFISASILPGVHVVDFGAALLVSIILGVLNAVIKPMLLVLTLPITIVTLGLFTFVLNAFMILVTDTLVAGFQVDSFWFALLFSLVLSAVSWFLTSLTEKK